MIQYFVVRISDGIMEYMKGPYYYEEAVERVERLNREFFGFSIATRRVEYSARNL